MLLFFTTPHICFISPICLLLFYLLLCYPSLFLPPCPTLIYPTKVVLTLALVFAVLVLSPTICSCIRTCCICCIHIVYILHFLVPLIPYKFILTHFFPTFILLYINILPLFSHNSPLLQGITYMGTNTPIFGEFSGILILYVYACVEFFEKFFNFNFFNLKIKRIFPTSKI